MKCHYQFTFRTLSLSKSLQNKVIYKEFYIFLPDQSLLDLKLLWKIFSTILISLSLFYLQKISQKRYRNIYHLNFIIIDIVPGAKISQLILNRRCKENKMQIDFILVSCYETVVDLCAWNQT